MFRRLALIGTLVLLCGALWTAAATAQTPGLTVTPSALTIAGTRGMGATRTLLLRTTEPITGLQTIPLDLPNAAGEVVLPAAALTVALPATEIAAGGLLTVPVTVALRGVPSGRFSGELLLHYSGGALSVPVTVTVKDPPWGAAAVTLIGVALGVWMNRYRAQGRPRDALLVRIGQFRAPLQAETAFETQASAFKDRIDGLLYTVEALMQAEQWTQASQVLDQVQELWGRWHNARAEWLVQFRYADELEARLKEWTDGGLYVQSLRRELEDARRDTPDLPTQPGVTGPEEFQQRLDRIAQAANRYLRLKERVDELNQLGQASAATAFQRRLNELAWTAETDLQKLEQELETAVVEARKATPPAATETFRDAGMTAFSLEGAKTPGVFASAVSWLLGAPAVSTRTPAQQAQQARQRLNWFTLISYAVAVLLLAGAGFGELYVARAEFGANPWGDYFALLAWGFGAETARASITETLSRWGLPGTP